MDACDRLFLALLVAAVAGCSNPGDKVDSAFDTTVANPAYKGEGPRVLFDDAHHNVHRPGKSYRPFVELLKSDGYAVTPLRRSVSADELSGYDVYVIAGALGTNETNDAPAFTDEECDAVREWVSGGGSLLLIADHFPSGRAVDALAQRFGVRMGSGAVEDSLHFDPGFESSHIVFSRENGGLVSHPVTNGRNDSERVERVLAFTGDALSAAPPAVTFLVLSSDARARAASATVRKHGDDVMVDITYGDPTPVAGNAFGISLEYGKGRVVVLGEATMFTARLRRDDHRPIGMNTPGYDNRRLALNIMHWLTAAPL